MRSAALQQHPDVAVRGFAGAVKPVDFPLDVHWVSGAFQRDILEVIADANHQVVSDGVLLPVKRIVLHDGVAQLALKEPFEFKEVHSVSPHPVPTLHYADAPILAQSVPRPYAEVRSCCEGERRTRRCQETARHG